MKHGEAKWTASNRYWRKISYFVVVVCTVGPFIIDRDGMPLWQAFAILYGFVFLPLLWTYRLSAWEEDDALVIRSWFTTKRRLWNDIDHLCLIERDWGRGSWVTAAVRHGKKYTYLNSMNAVSAGGVAQLLDELNVLASRHDLDVDAPPDATFRAIHAGVRGFRPFD